MKQLILLIALLYMSSSASAQNNKDVPKYFYTCVMHPEIHESKPGNCPKCGMALVKEKVKTPKKVVVKKPAAPKKVTTPTKKPDTDRKKVDSVSIIQDSISRIEKQIKVEITEEKTELENTSKQTTQSKTVSKTVRYDLYVKDTIVHFGNKPKRAIAVNGQIPMPTLTFTEGDTAEVYVHNQLKESTSIHWHGLFLPNKEDGVPYLTQMPIEPGTTHKYSFPIIQQGTHWYHSHSGLQEQIGMYGSMILNKKPEDITFRNGIDDLPAIPVILSEWTDMNPKNVHRMLHNATDWFAIQKGTTQSYAEAIKQGHFKTKLRTNGNECMLWMLVIFIMKNF